MRVINHKQAPKVKQKNPKNYGWILIVIVVIGGAGIYLTTKPNEPDASKNNDITIVKQDLPEPPLKKGTLKVFSAEEFRDLYNDFAWPNTKIIASNQPITGNTEADERIRDIAEERGYKVRSAPVSNVFINIDKSFRLQQKSAEGWRDMVDSASKDGINLTLTDGYRSADAQRDIFLGRLHALGIQISRIASGAYDKQLNDLMSITAPPSYSRHHSGYTVDISCDGNLSNAFELTDCFEWLSQDNYKNAKTHGWIPSYPEGTDMQGPEPESWEYVWVGKDSLTE